MKVLRLSVLVLLFFSAASLLGQSPVFDTASYAMPHPAGWGKEIFPIPIEFAPAIPYTGQEELRFAPGWGDSTSAEYWSYAYVWFINGQPDITQEGMEQNLQQYYT
ncbi:MAG: hypothetical protein H0X41_13905, partial [Chitinophagaceae bacterium]|nr:hypothetical protein [Chitinophagaceae bacterium]